MGDARVVDENVDRAKRLGRGGDDLGRSCSVATGAVLAVLPEFRIAEDEGVKYAPRGSFRYLANVTNLYASSNAGLRSLQDFKKISIVEAKGSCYGWHFYQCADADMVVASDDALFGHSAFRYVGWAARMWQWALMMGLRPFMEMVFTGRPFTVQEMKELHFVNSVVPRDGLEAETMKYALSCACNNDAMFPPDWRLSMKGRRAQR